MKLMFPKYPFVGIALIIVVISLISSGDVFAQSKKAAPAKTPVTKPAAKKIEKQAKDVKKGQGNAKTVVKDNKKAVAKDIKKGVSRDNKKQKLTSKDKAKADAAANKNSKQKPETKKAAVERRRKEDERRRAALAEQRRREQAAREARARKLAFERGLRTETVANIANDQTAGEDLAIRQVAINALGSHAGSVVVMEAQTGKILTIVNQDWAVRSSIRPCSTIKLVTAAAGINEGVISKDDGSVRNVSTSRNLDDALAYSDNPYFQRVGSNVGNTKFVEYAKQLGLGEPTGLNLEGETAGRLPYSNNNGRIYSHGDDTEVSTIQLAVMVSAITNGGNRVLPRIPRNSIEKAKFQTFYKAKVELPQQSVRRVIPGMIGASEYGTARRDMNQELGVAGKTGSCIDKGSWVGLFASVAPIETPKYAIAVITRGQSERGRYAAAIAGKIYNALSGEIVRTNRNLAQTEFKIKSKMPIELNTAVAEADDDEDDAIGDETISDTVDVGIDNPKVIIVPNAVPQSPAPKKLVVKTVDSKPILPPVVITIDKDSANKKNNSPIKP